MAIRMPVLSVDDQEYYPLHEEDDVPETPPHRQEVTYAYDALRARFREWFTTANVCVYWERGNTKDYRAPDLFVVKEPLSEPVTRVYQLWKQPPIAFALEVGSRSTFRQDVGPKVKLYAEKVKAAEYAHADLDRRKLRLWRLGPNGYVPVAPEANGRLRSAELGLEIDLDDAGNLRLYSPDGEPLRSHEESEQQLEVTEQRLEVTEQRLEEEARRRQEAEERAAELERQLAELRAGRADGDDRRA
jgi:Uma2 family endonuclease